MKLNAVIIKKFFPVIIVTLVLFVITLATFISIAARPDYAITNLYDSHWVNTASPDEAYNVSSIAQKLSPFDVIIFGELHRHPGIHLAQMQLMQQLHQLRPDLSLSLEQFERDTQAILDAYLAGSIGEQHMRDTARAWDNYPSSYRPLVEYARQHQLSVIAANAPKNAVICVGRKGLEILEAMPEEDRKHVAIDIDVSDGAYKQKFMDFLNNNSSHGGGSHGSKLSDESSAIMKTMAARSFAAQVVRDETMAESIALYMQANPQHQLLHLTGQFHSASYLGMVERLARRMPELNIAVINPITLNQEKTSWQQADLETGTVLLLVGQLPEKFVEQDNAKKWSREILKKRKANECNIVPL